MITYACFVITDFIVKNDFIQQNIPEAIGLLVTQIMELIREGKHSVAQLMDLGRRLLGKRQVMGGILTTVLSSLNHRMLIFLAHKKLI